jgi:hypothetical protein
MTISSENRNLSDQNLVKSYSEETKEFWPSETNNLENQNEISLISLPKSKIFNLVSQQLRKWSALGIVRPFLLVDAEEFVLAKNETPRDNLRKSCEFIFPSYFKSIEDDTKLINPLFPYLSDLGDDLNLIRHVSVLSPDLDTGSSAFAKGIKELHNTIDLNRADASTKKKVVRLIIPSSKWLDDENKSINDCLHEAADVNLLVSPEDRSSPGAFNQGVMPQDNFVSHASFFIASSANLWVGQTENPFDKYERRGSKKEFVLIRGYGRLVVSDDIFERVAKNIRSEDGIFRTPNTRVLQPNRPSSLIEKKSSEFFNTHINNSQLKEVLKSSKSSNSKDFNFISYLVSRLKFGANSIFYGKENLSSSILKREVENLNSEESTIFNDDYILNLAEELVDENNINIAPNDISIYEDFVSKIFSQIDGKELLIEQSSDDNYTLLLDSNHLVGSDESILKSIDSKISEFKSYLGSAFVDWFSVFHSEYTKDVDGTIGKLLKLLKRLRFIEITSFITIFANISWFFIDVYQRNYGEIILFNSELTIPSYIPLESSYIILAFMVIFITSCIIGFQSKNNVFGSALSLVQIKNIIEDILLEMHKLDLVQQHLNAWKPIAGTFVNSPFIEGNTNKVNIKPLKEVNSLAKAFKIAEGEINPEVVSKITSEVTKQGWLHELYISNFEKFKIWRTNQNKPIIKLQDLQKSIHTDFSISSSGLRESFKEYVSLGFTTINGRKKLEAEISRQLQTSSAKTIFSKNITIVEDRGQKSDTTDKFFDSLDPKNESDDYFVPGVFTNKAIKDPNKTKVDRKTITGDKDNREVANESDTFDKEFFDLKIAVKAGTPIQRMKIRIDLSPLNPPDAVSKMRPDSDSPFDDVAKTNIDNFNISDESF